MATNIVKQKSTGLVVEIRYNQPVVDSRLIAEELGIKHKAFLGTVRKYQKDVNDLGQLPFETAVESKSNNPEVFCWLLEEQATFLMMLSRNTDQVVLCKKKLAKAFHLAKKLLQQKSNAEWLEARKAGKCLRKAETDGIQVFVEYAKSQGSQSAERYYCNLTNMEYKALFLVEQKYPNLRDLLDITQLALLGVAETVVRNALHEGMAKNLHYKEIYKLAKDRVEFLAIAHGKSAVPQQRQLPSA
jgi:phage regulator Rha-like protein